MGLQHHSSAMKSQPDSCKHAGSPSQSWQDQTRGGICAASQKTASAMTRVATRYAKEALALGMTAASWKLLE